jgi:cell wall-associated NlpC family hydrolase
MRSQRAIDSSGSGTKATRRGAGVLVCVLAIFALIVPAANAQSGSSDGQDLSALEAFITALGAPRAERAVDAIGHGLAMMEAQKLIAATEAKLAREEKESASAANVEKSAESEAEAESELEEAAGEEAAFEEVKNPSEMAPASAGSNGTTVPHSEGESGGKLFAHSRVDGDGSTAILLSGIALAPPDAPEAVQKVINNANMIVGRPYVWGGGHASFYSYGYDCSGSVSFALFGGGLIPEPLTSGALEGWGEPGPGKWITVYANAEHTFMEVAGLRWDTVGDARGTGPRWHLAPASGAGFVVRHPPGL